MAAEVQIFEMTAADSGNIKASGGYSGTVRFKSADDWVVDNNNRLQIPADGDPSLTYSYTKQLRFYFNTAPSVDIQNLRAYSDESKGWAAGVNANYLASGSWGANYNTAMAGTDLFERGSGDPIDLDLVNFDIAAGSAHSGTGWKGDFLVLQMTVASGVSPGELTDETLTFAYDET